MTAAHRCQPVPADGHGSLLVLAVSSSTRRRSRSRVRAAGSAVVAVLLACLAVVAVSSSRAEALTGDVAMHDPSVIKVGNCYYGYSTGDEGGRGAGTISIRRTCDAGGVTGWSYVGTIFNSMPGWITSSLGRTPPNLWAPDINYINGEYRLYYAGSYWGQQHTAVIGLATATNPAGPWTDRGQVTNINYPIDPNVFTAANGTMYIMWGSWPGTYMRVLDPATGKLSTSETRMWRIGQNIENQAIIQSGGYYYLFGSRGSCCVGVNSTYYTVVGRATTPTGPYLDRNGVDIARGGGTTVLTGSYPQVAAGGGDPFFDGSQPMFAYHYYDANANGRGTLNIRPITFSDGWPAMGAPVGTPAAGVSRLQSYNFPDRYVRHANFDARIDPNVSPTQDGEFRLVPGLADTSGYVSLESVNYPGYYLRHQGFDFTLAANDGTATFAADATFQRVPGLADSSAASFQSYNYPDRYIRHNDYLLRLDPITNALGRNDATFRVL